LRREPVPHGNFLLSQPGQTPRFPA
jgi:hypothetical protein